MIKYEGIKNINNFHYLELSNELGKKISIPIEPSEARRLAMWIDKLSTVSKTDQNSLQDENI